jgi:hypothetical protein
MLGTSRSNHLARINPPGNHQGTDRRPSIPGQVHPPALLCPAVTGIMDYDSWCWERRLDDAFLLLLCAAYLWFQPAILVTVGIWKGRPVSLITT